MEDEKDKGMQKGLQQMQCHNMMSVNNREEKVLEEIFKLNKYKLSIQHGLEKV